MKKLSFILLFFPYYLLASCPSSMRVFENVSNTNLNVALGSHDASFYPSWYCTNGYEYYSFLDTSRTVSVGGTTYIYITQNTYRSVSSCPAGTFLSPENICITPLLSDYDNDPVGCSQHGGHLIGIGTKQVGGTSYGASFFGGKGIILGGDIEQITKCASNSEVVGTIAGHLVGLLPFASKLIPSSALKRFSNLSWSAKLNKWNQPDGLLPPPNAPKQFPDTVVNPPKIKLEIDPATGTLKPSTGAHPPVINIEQKPINGTSYPTRPPNIEVAPEYKLIPDLIVPSRPNNDPVFDLSIVDAINTYNNIEKLRHTIPNYPQPAPVPLKEVVPPKTQTFTVRETIDLSKYLPHDYPTSYTPPAVVGQATAETSLTKSFEGTKPVDTYITTKLFPDGSKLMQSTKIYPTTGEGEIATTTVSPDGISNTTRRPILVNSYPTAGASSTFPDGATIVPHPTIPASSTNNTPVAPIQVTNPDNTTTTIFPDGSTQTYDAGGNMISFTPSEIRSAEDAISNQNLDNTINAVMPDYTLPSLPDFTLFSFTDLKAGFDNFSEMFDNIRMQLSTFGETYDNTMSILNGSYEPPQIPAGSCGTTLSREILGKHVDLCPPMTEFAHKISPLVTFLITISGLILAVRIYLSAFKD